MFGRKTIVDNAKDFSKEFPAVQIISVQYLTVWFKQVFETPEYKEMFADMPTLPEALATEIVKYLSAQDPEEDVEHEEAEVFAMAKKHVHKWTDDVMERDHDFCELRVQTLRLDMIYAQYAKGVSEWMESQKGKRVSELLNKYGHLVPEQPDPKTYSKMVKNWIVWAENARKQGLI